MAFREWVDHVRTLKVGLRACLAILKQKIKAEMMREKQMLDEQMRQAQI